MKNRGSRELLFVLYFFIFFILSKNFMIWDILKNILYRGWWNDVWENWMLRWKRTRFLLIGVLFIIIQLVRIITDFFSTQSAHLYQLIHFPLIFTEKQHILSVSRFFIFFLEYFYFPDWRFCFIHKSTQFHFLCFNFSFLLSFHYSFLYPIENEQHHRWKTSCRVYQGWNQRESSKDERGSRKSMWTSLSFPFWFFVYCWSDSFQSVDSRSSSHSCWKQTRFTRLCSHKEAKCRESGNDSIRVSPSWRDHSGIQNSHLMIFRKNC